MSEQDRIISQDSDRRQKLLRDAFGHLQQAGADSAIDADSTKDMGQPIQRVVKLVARHFGMKADHLRLSSYMAGQLDDLTALRRLADKAGIRLRLAKLPPAWEKDDFGVLIGFYGEKRLPAALMPGPKKGYIIYGTGDFSGRHVDGALAAELGNEAFVCYPGLPQEQLSPRQAFLSILKNVWSQDKKTILMVSLVAGLLPLFMPLIVENIFNHIIPINDRQALGTAAQVMLTVGFAQAALALVRAISCLRLKIRFGMLLEAALWSRLLSLPANFFRNWQVGELVSRMHGASGLVTLLDNSFVSTIFSLIFSIFSLLLMFFYSAKLSLYAILIWVIYLICAAFLYRRVIFSQKCAVESANRVSARTLQLLDGISVFKSRAAEETAFYLWAKTFGENWRWTLSLRRQGNRIGMLNAATPLILSMTLYYITADMFIARPVWGRPLDLAEFMAFQVLFSGVNASLMQFMPLLSSIYSFAPQMENIRPVLAAIPENRFDMDNVGMLSGSVEAKSLYFSYSDESPAVLEDVSFKIDGGQHVAFVGASGCGKSTLVRLLLGFEYPQRGGIFYNNMDLAALDIQSVRSQIGVVLQNSRLMAGDILTNIIGTMPLGMDDAWEAAKLVAMDEDIKSMPMGMHTMISEGGGNLSGGQRQRILLARCLVHKPKVIIMDEATSALDNIAQAKVMESIKAIRATRITIAHRLSTIREADCIFVLAEGRIVEQGTYEELIGAGAWFARLAQRQLI